MNAIKRWYDQIKEFDQISFKEAQEQYKKAIECSDEKEKTEQINMIIEKTFYNLYSYIKDDIYDFFQSSTYDVDDIISSLCEQWVSAIKNGDLLTKENYSAIYYNNNMLMKTLNSLCDYKQYNESYKSYESFSLDKFSYCFYTYIKLREINKKIDLDEFFESCDCNYDGFERIYNICQTLYDVLNVKDISKLYNDSDYENIRNMALLLLDVFNNNRNRIDENKVSYINLEDIMIKQIDMNEFKDVIEESLSNREKEILYEYYGINGLGPDTLDVIADEHNVSGARVGQIKRRAEQELKSKQKVKNMINYI